MQSVKTISPDISKDDSKVTLKDIVREALLAVLSDAGASAAAKASAGRTLMQFCDEKQRDSKRGADMSSAELNEAIERAERSESSPVLPNGRDRS